MAESSLLTNSRVANLCLVLDDIKSNLSGLQVTAKQSEVLSKLIEGCRSVLDDTEELIRKNESLGADSSGLGSKTQKAWKKMKWDSASVKELRDRMVSSTTYLNTFSTSLARSVQFARRKPNHQLILAKSNVTSDKGQCR